MAIPQEFITQLKDRVEIDELIGGYVKLRRQGSGLTGLCPFHSEKTPSFHVYTTGDPHYYCFGCGAGGDAITFVREIEHLDYVEAVSFLADRVGLKVPEEQGDAAAAKERADLLELNRTAARWFHSQLRGSPEAIRYLSGRGLTQQTILHFGLGYAPDSWDALLTHLKQQGHSEPDIRRAGLAAVNKSGRYYDYFRNRIIFPIIDVRGRVIAFGGRVQDDSQPKYLNSPDTPVFKKSYSLFSLNNAKSAKEGRLILAEGYLDVIALHQAGFPEAVATLGTALTSDQARLMKRHADEIVIAYDSDQAGQRATDRAIRILGDAGLKTRILTLPGAKDPDEYLRQHSPDLLRAQLNKSEGAMDFRLQQAARSFDLEDAAGRVEYLREAVALLAELRSPLEADVYASRLAQQLQVEKDTILSEVERVRRGGKKRQEQRLLSDEQKRQQQAMAQGNPEKPRHLRAAQTEEALIGLLFRRPDYYEAVRQRLSADDFVTAVNRRLFERQAEVIEAGDLPDLAHYHDFDTKELGALSGLLTRTEGQLDGRQELDRLIDDLLEASSSAQARLRIDQQEYDITDLRDRFHDMGTKK